MLGWAGTLWKETVLQELEWLCVKPAGLQALLPKLKAEGSSRVFLLASTTHHCPTWFNIKPLAQYRSAVSPDIPQAKYCSYSTLQLRKVTCPLGIPGDLEESSLSSHPETQPVSQDPREGPKGPKPSKSPGGLI